MKKVNFIVLASFVFGVLSITAVAQSGGAFVITKSVIAGGGGQSAAGGFLLDGTVGQSMAGTRSTGGTFELGGGFWGGGATAAPTVSVSGRVFTTIDGQGLRNAIVTMTDPQGLQRRAVTSTFGNYQFDNVVTGQTYIFSVASRRFRYAPQLVPVNGTLTFFNFLGLE